MKVYLLDTAEGRTLGVYSTHALALKVIAKTLYLADEEERSSILKYDVHEYELRTEEI